MIAKAAIFSLLLLGSSAGLLSQQTCSLAIVEGLSTPRFIATAETYQVIIRRRQTANPRFDELLLYDALYKALTTDASQQMSLKAVVSESMMICEGFRVLGLSVKRENVSFASAPKPQLKGSSTTDMKPVRSGTSQAAEGLVAPGTDETIEQLIDLWQSGKANTGQLQQLWSLTASRGDRKLQEQLFRDVAESMRKEKLPEFSLERFELKNKSLPKIQLEPTLEKKSY